MSQMLKDTLLNTLPKSNNANTGFEIKHCPKCGEPITKVIELLGKKRLVPVACSCRAKELEKFNAKMEHDRKKDTLDRVFSTRLNTKNTKDICFENWNDDLGNVELKSLGYKYCNTFDSKFKGNIGFALNGNAGVGKSYLSLCIAKEIEKKGYTVLTITISEILDKLKESYSSSKNSNRETQLNKMLVAINSADLLILDDLGVETPSLWVNNIIYRLIDSRYMNRKPLIITTNLKDFSRYDEEGRISSRLSEMCRTINVNGDDIRRVKAKVKGMDIVQEINSSLNVLNNKIDKPYNNLSENEEENKIDFRKQVILGLNSCKNIFGEKAINEFSNRDIEYVVNRIEKASNKIYLLNGFINNVRNNSKSTKLRELALDYIKFAL